VSVVILNPDDEVLLLRHSYGPNVWGLPSGGMKGRENPADCARREVREELGMALDSLVQVGELEEVLSGAPHTAHLFVATSAAQPKPDRREVIEARFFPPQSLPEPLGAVTRRRVEAWRAMV
jgi:8-oxo-dGTP pyrophosphatase MutT (NUDIX family)